MMRKFQEGFISVTEKDEGEALMTPSIKRSIKSLHSDNSKDNMAITVTNIDKVALLEGNYTPSNF